MKSPKPSFTPLGLSSSSSSCSRFVGGRGGGGPLGRGPLGRGPLGGGPLGRGPLGGSPRVCGPLGGGGPLDSSGGPRGTNPVSISSSGAI